MTISYSLRFDTPPTCRDRSPYLYPSLTGWPSYTPRHWVPFSSPPTPRRATVEIFKPASTRGCCSSGILQIKVKVTLRLTVCQSVSLGVEPHLWPMTRYLLPFDSYGLVFLGRLLLREGGSVIYKCCWPSTVHSFTDTSPVGLATIFYCPRFETSFCRLLRLAGLRWRYSAPPPHGKTATVKVKVRVKSKLLYNWRFTANQFVLVFSSLRSTTRDFFSQLNPCGISPYITSPLMRRWVCLF
jgi:hypothetical protein